MAIEDFLASPYGSRLVAATTALERARALNDWLNAAITPDPGDLAEMQARSTSSRRKGPHEGAIVLRSTTPPPEMTLVAALRERRSDRTYSDRPLSMDSLGKLLRNALGVGRRVAAYGRGDYPLSVAPSGGGLNSVAAYTAIRTVDGVPPGVYRYNWIADSLDPHVPGDPTLRLSDIYQQAEFMTAAVTLFLVGRLGRVLSKYSVRHYRVLHIDAGIATQNLYLVGAALGLSCCAVTGFCDAAVNDLLGLDEAEIPILVFAVGYPRTDEIP